MPSSGVGGACGVIWVVIIHMESCQANLLPSLLSAGTDRSCGRVLAWQVHMQSWQFPDHSTPTKPHHHHHHHIPPPPPPPPQFHLGMWVHTCRSTTPTSTACKAAPPHPHHCPIWLQMWPVLSYAVVWHDFEVCGWQHMLPHR